MLAGGRFLIDRTIFHLYPRIPPLMTDSSARSLIQVVRASLRLAEDSVNSLTTSQLLALQARLRETLRIVGNKIQEDERSNPGESPRQV